MDIGTRTNSDSLPRNAAVAASTHPLVSAIAWSTAAALAIIGVTRIVWGRLPA